jgi:predicted CXXCH cytochrome family protein
LRLYQAEESLLKPKKSTQAKNRSRRWFLLIAVLSLGGLAFAGGGGLYAANMENHDAFCASCHTQPESTFYDRTQATGIQTAAAVDLASFHAAKAVNCIDCHSGSGLSGRLGAMTLGANDMRAYLSGHYSNPAVVTVPISDDNCLKCHADISVKREFQNHFHFFLPQWQRLDPAHAATCVECHQGHQTGGRADIKMLVESTTTAVCQRCHQAAGAGG